MISHCASIVRKVNMDNFNNLTASEIDTIKVEEEKKLKIAQANLNEVELQELEIAKQIIILRGKQRTCRF